MESDVRIMLFHLLLLPIFTHCSNFGLKFVTDLPAEIIAVPGSEVNLECSTNLPVDSIEWYLNHVEIPPQAIVWDEKNISSTSDKQFYSQRNEGLTSSITIPVETSSHLHSNKIGIYQCIAVMGSIKLASSPCRLDIATLDALPVGVGVADMVVAAGESVRLPCPSFNSVPPPVFSFTKDGLPLHDDDGDIIIITEAGELLLLYASPAMSGSYQCHATNSVLNKTVSASPLQLNVSEEISPESKIVSPASDAAIRVVREGDSTTLHCLMTAESVATLKWSKDGMGLSDDSLEDAEIALREVDRHFVHNYLLSIHVARISQQHAGKYTCSSDVNGQGHESSVQLFVEVAPEIKCSPFPPSLVEGDKLSVQCQLEGVPHPLFRCLNNGENLALKEGVSVTRDGHLTVERMEKSFSGVLQCFAHNSAGSSCFNSYISVIPNTVEQHQEDTSARSGSSDVLGRGTKDKLGKKSAPSSITPSKVASDAVKVCWNAPSALIQGNRLLFYKVQYKLLKTKPSLFITRPGDSRQQWRTDDTVIYPHNKCHTVLGLRANATYKFRVAAVYASHDSVVSRSSKWFVIVPDTPLLPPPSPKLLALELNYRNSSVYLRWSYQSTLPTDGFIISYKVLGSEESDNHLRFLGGLRRSISIPDVPLNTSLAFYVRAFNMAGSSSISNLKYFLTTKKSRSFEVGAALTFGSNSTYETKKEKLNPILNTVLIDDDSEEDESAEDFSDELPDYDDVSSSAASGISSLHLLIVLSCLLFLLLLIVLVPSLLRAYRRRRNNDSNGVTQIEVECPITGGCSAVTPLQLSQMCQDNSTSNVEKNLPSYPLRPRLTEPD